MPKDHSDVNIDSIDGADVSLTAVERFLQTVEKKTHDPVHHRLLKKSREDSHSEALETELRAILSEIVNEN